MDRRTFLSSLALLGLEGCFLDAHGAALLADRAAKGRKRCRGGAPRFDDNLVCFISDLHVNPPGYQPARLERTIADILTLDPLPRNVIALGDLAYLTGRKEEYARLKEIIAPLEAAGIQLTMAMGNHDRRDHFAEAFPSYAARSQMADRHVFIVETPYADFIALDTLQASPDPDTWITPGALNEAQVEWLKERLAAYQKPVFVMSHHPLEEIGIKKILMESPTCCGYIYGHNHVWRPGWVHQNYRDRTVLRTLCIPSTGHWGDIGYVLMDLGETEATARLHQYEFFFPKPLEEGEPKPVDWTHIEEEHRDALCHFVYR